MNWQRGFLRIWIILSVVFAAGVAVLSTDDIEEAYQRDAFYAEIHNYIRLVPVKCSGARGKEGVHFKRAVDTNMVHCWYEMPKFRALFPEYKDMTDDTLSDRLYVNAGIPTKRLPSLWKTLAITAGKPIGVPISVLALGCAITWIAAGSRSRNILPRNFS
jgi:hypothetical protein